MKGKRHKLEYGIVFPGRDQPCIWVTPERDEALDRYRNGGRVAFRIVGDAQWHPWHPRKGEE